MESTEDVDGQSLLHNSMILYGSGNADGNRHTHDNLPIVLAGARRRRVQARALREDQAACRITNLFLSMADGMGAKGVESHGDSTGRLI